MHNIEIGLIEIKSRSIEAESAYIKTKSMVLEAEIRSAFKINIARIEGEVSAIERTAENINIDISAIENNIKFILEKTILNEWKMKALKNRIGVIGRIIKRSTVNVLTVYGKIKKIKTKVTTASPKQPFIKHHQFSVTR